MSLADRDHLEAFLAAIDGSPVCAHRIQLRFDLGSGTLSDNGKQRLA
jgi:hypothetical protein